MRTTTLAVLTAFFGVPAFAAPSQGKPLLDHFLYGTQYYRAPTPLPDEWETDLANLADWRLDTIQLRLNWRQNERLEDVYDFSDVDRLMDLAEKYGKKVIVKFLLECAPQYVFEKYGGTRIGAKGEKVAPKSHGAFYTGGWLPCFTNPKVAERATKFVEKVVARYCQRKNLILWNAWNEPRNKPVEECFCPECRKAFAEHLRAEFGTIEKLNAFYGVAEESFETIALPGGTKGYWDIFAFKRFKSRECIRRNLKGVFDAVRRHDRTHPVISHIGVTSGFQTFLGDLCDDYAASRSVDGWGTSLPLFTKMDDPAHRIEYNRLNDFLRSIDRNYYVYEIYPGLGMFWDEYDDEWDMDYKLFDGLANGAKGLFFWQYRAERVGHENDCAGLARADGSPRPVLNSVKRVGDVIAQLDPKILGFYPDKADVVIVFDYDSQLMGEVEESPGLTSEVQEDAPLAYYPNAHKGFYALMHRNDFAVDYVNSRNLKDLAGRKVVYLPPSAMLDETAIAALEGFVEDGGTVIADEGFVLRQPNTWMNPYDLACGRIMKARMRERRFGKRAIRVGDDIVQSPAYNTIYDIRNARTILSFEDGTPAAQEVVFGKGRFVLLGFSLGYCAAQDPSDVWLRLFGKLVRTLPPRRTYARFREGLEERRLRKGNEQFVFLINTTDAERRIPFDEPVAATYAQGRIEGTTAVVPPKSCLMILSVSR